MTTLKTYMVTGIENWGAVISDDFKNFARLYQSMLKRMCKRNNWQLVNFNRGHYYCSWFIKNEQGQHIYMSFSDVRYFSHDWWNSILYRTAKSDSDYTGGCNCYTDLVTMEGHIRRMFFRYPN